MPVFRQAEALGATVLRHEGNRGKGAALKTGILAMSAKGFTGIVTADADGQHTPDDICRIIDAMRQNPEALVLGMRAFRGNVPWKSKAGNAITRVVFRFATGVRVNDTQTGLRGLPSLLFAKLAALKGDRYEYEMNMLLRLRDWETQVVEIPIETIYIEGNASSHFHPLRDSVRIYSQILRFGASSGISFLVDYGLYMFLAAFFLQTSFVSYALARLVSSYVNYMLNRHLVFRTGGKGSLLRYYLLAACILVVGASGTQGLTMLGVNAFAAKLIVDIPLFFASFTVQRSFIFRPGKKNGGVRG